MLPECFFEGLATEENLCYNDEKKGAVMKHILFGTDFGSDCDDAVALRILARAAKRGEIDLVGVAINTCMEDSVASVDGFLSKEGLSHVPIGIDKNAPDYPGPYRYQKRLAAYAKHYLCNEDAEDAVHLYRRILAESNAPVEIVEVGFLQVIAAVLESGGDGISPETGVELFKRKVRRVWLMGGRFDVERGKEWNLSVNAAAADAAARFCALCPVPVTFLGFEVGHTVITGGKLQPEDHLHDVLVDYGRPQGRASWDPMTAQLAVIGDAERAGYTTVRGHVSVDAATGENTFRPDECGPHCYVVKAYPDAYYADEINAAIQ